MSIDVRPYLTFLIAIGNAKTPEDRASMKRAFEEFKASPEGLRDKAESDKAQAERNARASRTRGYGGPPVPDYIDDLYTFMTQGGMHRIEQRAANEAVKIARRIEQEYWLETLKAMIADGRILPEGGEIQWGEFFRGKNEDPKDLARASAIANAKREIKRLRRILGQRQTPEEKRAATLRRVRKYRASK